MGFWRMVRLAALFVAVYGLLLAGAANAQGPHEVDLLRAEVDRLIDQGKYGEAIPVAERYVALARQIYGEERWEFASALGWLGFVNDAQGRYAEAESLYQRSLDIYEKARGPNLPRANVIMNLAHLYQVQGRFTEAEALYRRGLPIVENLDDITIAQALTNMAGLYYRQGRYAEAEPLYERSLGILEHMLPESAPLASCLNSLAGLYMAQRRHAEAEPLFRRSLAIREKYFGPEHPDVAGSLASIASLYWEQGRYAEAEPLFRRSLAIDEKALGPEHPDVAERLNDLAELYRVQRRYSEAEPLSRRSLSIVEKVLGPENPDVASHLNTLALLYHNQGRFADAEPLLKRSLAIDEKVLGPENPTVAALLNNLAWLNYDQSNWGLATDYFRRGTGVIERRAKLGLAGDAEGGSKGEAQRWSRQFGGLIKATYRLVPESHAPRTTAADTFETAQWAEASEAAASLTQMAARSAMGSPELAKMVRERQDLVRESQEKGKLLVSVRSAPFEGHDLRDAGKKALMDRLAAIKARLAAIDQQLTREFPNYTALASPAPVSIAEVQAQLSDDEALVLFRDTPERQPQSDETFVWAVTKSDVRWVRSELSATEITREVMALRCGLDDMAWDGAGAKRCAEVLGLASTKTPDPLPFDLARAHKLYAGLFNKVHDLIANKHLLIVPSGALTQLPFQALVTQAPDSASHRTAAWLARSHAVTVLPAASSLKALRRVGRPSTAPRALIGIGNPLLDGYRANPKDKAEAKLIAKHHAQWAEMARKYRSCPEMPQQLAAVHSRVHLGVARVDTRRGLANVAYLKMLTPLPETAGELCAVAKAVKSEPRDIHLGAQATESVLKALSRNGELAQYRMIHFATHGAMAGEIGSIREPGLILTPPKTATEEDDGYLSASEIAGLKLDADWVVLSACNTAAGGAASAEALSGLARAFIYAGARALLVSHWAVYSEATVKLVSAAIDEMVRDPKVGRAEALRRAMLDLIDHGTVEEAHPSYWAPFVVVGEGAAGR
jgi:CHAT domain-containing protein/tetratricopeptide (TPR) repeat protein